jgi:3D-(3,5/4)-trihydroxycyclohexane-1,2-dione acylhydrolase (decyclizing)
VVLVQNHGFASIGSLSQSVGSQRFGTAYRYRDKSTGRLDGEKLPVDLAANAASLGARVIRAATIADLTSALRDAKAAGGPVVIAVETDPLAVAPDSQSWWDVPVAEVSELDSVRQARAAYESALPSQRRYL